VLRVLVLAVASKFKPLRTDLLETAARIVVSQTSIASRVASSKGLVRLLTVQPVDERQIEPFLAVVNASPAQA
jgi:hypothetical protein